MKIRSVCVFCGSSPGLSPGYAKAALAFGLALGGSGRRLVYGGGNIGLMGLLAETAAGAGAEVVGIIPQKLNELVDQPAGTQLIVVPGMRERKAKMAELADAFVALPGGLGTLDELFEVWTERQLGYHPKPIGLLEVEGFFAPLLAFLGSTAAAGFMKASQLAELLVEEDPLGLLEALEAAPPPSSLKLPERRRT